MQIITKKLLDIHPYANNPRKNDQAVDAVASSIREFGFKVPVVIDKNGEIIAGHTRYKAAKKLGMKEIPCIIADDLTEEQIRAFRLADNKVGEMAEWDFDLLDEELEKMSYIDMEEFGFDFKEPSHFWGDEEGERTEEYNEFEEKFKPKLTTDDCYTPEEVYEVVKNWAVKEYGLEGKNVVRPFYPGGDYQNEKYGENDVVIDNPPFSILSEICRFYMEREIPFFLFAPQLTLFSTAAGECKYIAAYCDVEYENGAKVRTGFVTNMGEFKIITAPDLKKQVEEANKDEKDGLPSYDYPENVVTSMRLGKWVGNGANIRIKNATFIRVLDSQKEDGKAIYGGGFLISDTAAEKAAAEKAAAEKAAAEKEVIFWELSGREREMIEELNEMEKGD